MHTIICAAAPATPELKIASNGFFKQQGCIKNVFTEFYGSSETAVATIICPRTTRKNPNDTRVWGKRCAETRVYDEEGGASLRRARMEKS